MIMVYESVPHILYDELDDLGYEECELRGFSVWYYDAQKTFEEYQALMLSMGFSCESFDDLRSMIADLADTFGDFEYVDGLYEAKGETHSNCGFFQNMWKNKESPELFLDLSKLVGKKVEFGDC